jgi:phosphoenolpyruvate-protein phosphotransferase (PTS system enzyme I)
MHGLPVSEGIGMGHALILKKAEIIIPTHPCEDAHACFKAFEEAIEKSREDLKRLKENAASKLSADELEIFDAHLQMTSDIEIIKGVKARIENAQENPAFAYQAVTQEFQAMFEAMDDPYFKERASDIKDVAYRVLTYLTGGAPKDLGLLNRPTIIVADDLTPSDTASLDLNHVKGFITKVGGYTSHTAIMARSLNIPAVAGVKEALTIASDALIYVDAYEGQIYINPSAEEKKELDQKLASEAAFKKTLEKYVDISTTQDGHLVHTYANIGSPSDLEAVMKVKALGIGLFRTEFLFMDKDKAPTLEEQIKAYQDVLKAVKTVIIRTLDIGGDKNLPYLKMPHEDNPFLGHRAIRLCFDELDLFKTQLKAILIAGTVTNEVRIMFPMIARIDELLKAKAILKDVENDLMVKNIPYQKNMQIGIMIEIPAAALNTEGFAPHVDFFSIGTNDLIQYTYAADRLNEKVSYLYEPLDPTLLRLIDHVVQAAHKHHKEVGVCGEMAADPLAAQILIGLGVDEISMSAGNILKVRHALHQKTLADLKTLSQNALACENADQVKALNP